VGAGTLTPLEEDATIEFSTETDFRELRLGDGALDLGDRGNLALSGEATECGSASESLFF